MDDFLQASTLTRLHDRYLSMPGWPATALANEPDSFMGWLTANHCFNTLLWHEEDKARRIQVGDNEIADGKRLIDRYNQQRNDAIEAMDEALLGLLQCSPDTGARLNSETAGAMLDRLSIMALKIHHMREQTWRTDAEDAHLATCRAKLAHLEVQRRDLAGCFDELIADIRRGRAYFKVCRQFKMYNDPKLNPYLYGAQACGDFHGRGAR